MTHRVLANKDFMSATMSASMSAYEASRYAELLIAVGNENVKVMTEKEVNVYRAWKEQSE